MEVNELRVELKRLIDRNHDKLFGRSVVKEIPEHIKAQLRGEISGYRKVLNFIGEEDAV